MKVILYIATTVNGFIATQEDEVPFVTPAESASYVAAVCGAGATIVGRRTYEILSTQTEFQEFLKAGVKMIAVSRGDFQAKDVNHAVAHSPKEALELVKDFKEVIVAGGGMLNASFLEENLIDEIYLDVEPAIVSEGVALFSGSKIDKELKFLGSKVFGEGEIQLHYQVIK